MSAVHEPPPKLHRFTRAEYEQMVAAGIFGPEKKIELLDGEIIDIAPQKSRHATAVTLCARALDRAFGAGVTVRAQLPLSLDDQSEPEPDVAVVRGNPRDYRDAHPSTALLIVEVAESTLAYDRARKLAAYARNAIPEYWILNVADETLEVCRAPQGETYSNRQVLGPSDRVAPLHAADHEVPIADLLP
ncbi:MAG TPA: Uma2 family endonuclease [Burkholderiaceae bacterium]|nr:Uma2 family endonuclease [Burkholderiaceae bacterium]